MHCQFHSVSMPDMWHMHNDLPADDQLHQNSHWWYHIILCMYGVHLDTWMLDKNLYVIDNSDFP
jgi:hypothetical protein